MLPVKAGSLVRPKRYFHDNAGGMIKILGFIFVWIADSCASHFQNPLTGFITFAKSSTAKKEIW